MTKHTDQMLPACISLKATLQIFSAVKKRNNTNNNNLKGKNLQNRDTLGDAMCR